jgi:hypothetical protein
MIFAQRKEGKEKDRPQEPSQNYCGAEFRGTPVTQNRIVSEGVAWRPEWNDWVEGERAFLMNKSQRNLLYVDKTVLKVI